MPGGEGVLSEVRFVPLLLLGFFMTSLNNFAEANPATSSATPRGAAELVRGADLVVVNAKIWTGEPARSASQPSGESYAQAVAVLDGRILLVGTNAQVRTYVGPNTQVLDLGGRLVVPGLIDSHVHFIEGGFQLLRVDLNDARSEEEFTRRLAEQAKKLPPGRWIQGGNWDETKWPSSKLPTRWMIDPVTGDHPTFISRYDGHAALANSLALKLAGVSKETCDPDGGVIVRDPKTGEPTGVLKDAAEGLVTRVIPRPREAEMQEALEAGLAEARRVGVTSVDNITVDAESWNGSFTGEIQLLRRAERAGQLTARFYEVIPIARWERLADAGVSRDMGSDFLKLGAVKGFADGSLGSGTAWMFDPFDDEPGNRGLAMAIMNPPTKMEALVRGADETHIQTCVHAIGDRAIAEMLDLYARVGGSNPAAHRFRIEHAQHVRRQDFARFGKLGVIASMQPYHAIDDGRWAERRLGHKRARTSYAWRSMLNAGAHLAFGSDWPVAPLDPLLGIYAAVTRATLDGKHPGGWIPEEKLTVEEALRAYTTGSAFAAFQEDQKGTIAPGKLADLVVLSRDLFSIPPEQIRDTRVVLTVVGGKVVYRAM
jgi:predicted amidohydrolase YtcJ